MIDSGLVRRLRHDARTASGFAHGRPAYAAGIRAAIATVAPLLAAGWLPAGAATWASLAGLNGAIIDRGGPYRTRAAIMGTLAFASAVAIFIASLAGRDTTLAVVVTFIVAMLCGLSRAWVEVGPGFGVTVLVTFAIGLALPTPTVSDALVRALFILAGGAWAMLLAIVLWPIRPYRPVRLRIAECYRAIARYTEAAAADMRGGVAYDPSMLTSHVNAVRATIDAARTALAVIRRGRAMETRRGERLLVLHEIADQTFAHLFALTELSDSVGSPASPERLVLAETLAGIASTLRGLADAVESERDIPRVPIPWNGTGIRPASAAIADIVDRIDDYLAAAAEIASTLNSGAAPPKTSVVDVGEPPPEPVLFSLEAVLHPTSVVLHHAVRVALVTTAAVLISAILHLNHGYWVTLTAVVILQPYAALSRQKALQRVVGTILGGLVAAGITAVFHGGWPITMSIALFTMLCVALLPLNYGAYAVLGTPAFVLLAEASIGDWHLVGLRIENTLIGGALALIGAQLLWPGEERNRLPELAAAAIRANAALLRRTIELVAARESDLSVLGLPRRDVGNAALNADDSLQRLLSEHRGHPDELEAVMALLIYVRRIAASTVSLAVAASVNPVRSAGEIEPFARASEAILADLADAAQSRRAPAAFPPIGSIAMPSAEANPAVYSRVVRLSRQLRLMHDAVARWFDPQAEMRVVHVTGEMRAPR